MSEYAIIYERANISERANDGGWGTCVPDLPGLGVVGESFEEAQTLIREGIEIHIASLREFVDPVPQRTTRAETFAVAA